MELFSNSFLKKYLLTFSFILSVFLILGAMRRYIIPYTLPFLISYFISLVLRPIILRFENIGVSRSLSAFLFTAFIYLGVGSGVFLLIRRFIRQTLDFASRVLESPDDILSVFNKITGSITEKYPKLLESVDIDLVSGKIIEKLAGYAGVIVEKTAAFAISMPDVLLFVFAMIFSTYYFIKLPKDSGSRIKRLLPKSALAVGFYCKNLFVKYLKRYLVSMSVMLLIVFALLIVGFLILDVRYFVLLAFLISLIDMLPILGVGTVLVPWGVYSLIIGDLFRGFGLLFLYILILFIRQFAEPRLLGKGVGLSPLITLISIYIGYRSFGIVGVIFAPFIALVADSILHELSESTDISL